MTSAQLCNDLIAATHDLPNGSVVRDHQEQARQIGPMLLLACPDHCNLSKLGKRRQIKRKLQVATEHWYERDYGISPLIVMIIGALIEALLRWWFSDPKRGVRLLMEAKASPA